MKLILFNLVIFAVFSSQAFSAEHSIESRVLFDSDYNYLLLKIENNYRGGKAYANEKKPLSEVENLPRYTWTVQYSPVCSATCGSGYYDSLRVCKKSINGIVSVVDNAECLSKLGEYAPENKACMDWSSCGQSYTYTTWSECSGGASVQNREAICEDSGGNALPDIACNDIEKETLSRACSYALDCKDIMVNDPSAQSGWYWVSPDRNDVYHVYCDMDYLGGGWMLFSQSSASISEVTQSPTDASPGYLSADIMVKFANISSQVLVRQIDSVKYMVSRPGTYPIAGLRNKLEMSRLGSNNTYWDNENGAVSSTYLYKPNVGSHYKYPNLMLSANNVNGIKLYSNYGTWYCNYSSSTGCRNRMHYRAYMR